MNKRLIWLYFYDLGYEDGCAGYQFDTTVLTEYARTAYYEGYGDGYDDTMVGRWNNVYYEKDEMDFLG